MKRIIVWISILFFCINLYACQKKETEEQIANPMKEIETLAKAEERIGFHMASLHLPAGYEVAKIYIVDQNELQVVYTNGKDEITCCASKLLSSDEMDGDYNHYDVTSTISRDGYDVTLRETKTDYENIFMVHVAKWSVDDIHYLMYFSNPMDEEEVMQIICD